MPTEKQLKKLQKKEIKKQKKLRKIRAKKEKEFKKAKRAEAAKINKQMRKTKWPSGLMPYSNRMSYDDLVNLESLWGGTLFGPVPAGHQRKFFEHKRNVWVWYEGWIDRTGEMKEMTIRYEVRPAGVFKRVSGQKYEKITGAELENFRLAAKSYLTLLKSKLYY